MCEYEYLYTRQKSDIVRDHIQLQIKCSAWLNNIFFFGVRKLERKIVFNLPVSAQHRTSRQESDLFYKEKQSKIINICVGSNV